MYLLGAGRVSLNIPAEDTVRANEYLSGFQPRYAEGTTTSGHKTDDDDEQQLIMLPWHNLSKYANFGNSLYYR